MFLKLVVLLYAACVPLTCSEQTNDECFPLNMTSEGVWRFKTEGHSKTVVKRDTATKRNSEPGGSKIKFNTELEKGINKQINAELSAHYAYLSMSYYFEQDQSYMPGFSKFFKKMSEEEHEHAQMFMKYQNKRGGRIYLNSIPKPCDDGDWGNGTMAMKKALKLEKNINELLLALHTSVGNSDPQFLDFLESNFLGEQVDSIKELSNYVNILNRLGNALGEYQFDKLTLGGGKD